MPDRSSRAVLRGTTELFQSRPKRIWTINGMINFDARRCEAILLACMDPEPVTFNRVDEYHVGRARNAIKRAQRNGKTVGLQDVVRRNEFLAACLDHTRCATAEQLIIGYGFQHRNSTDIDRIRHVSGKERSVAIPPMFARTSCDITGAARMRRSLSFTITRARAPSQSGCTR